MKKNPNTPHDNYIQPEWPAPSSIHAYSTTRHGGISQAPYNSFNLGFRTEDRPENTKANRQQLTNDLQLPNEPIWLKQVHGNHVVCINDRPHLPEADAAIATIPNTICAILTADCMPILLCDRQGTKVAAIHAGWRGLAAGVIEETLKLLQLPPTEILAWLGPAIGPEIFEVGEEVREQFLKQDPNAIYAFKKSSLSSEKFLANIYLLAQQRLYANHVNQIYGGNFCTYTDTERFFSHRRDQGKTGRMASLIWIED